MSENNPQTIYLKDYQEPDFAIAAVDLHFELYEDHALVHSNLKVERRGEHRRPLKLHGQDLQLISVSIDGKTLDSTAYNCDEEQLTVAQVPDKFELSCTVKIHPQNNTSLEGLYKSRSMFCTQCEAEGFRKITYFMDRPDVLSVFTTTVSAEQSRYPTLLSNGNLIEQGAESDGRHWARWHDPHPKPAYLFALVAGDLAAVEDSFVTLSGRDVAIKLYVEAKDLDKCEHAVTALKNAMSWDERVYGREYDLDIYMIVAVDDFNMGAMENKGLNIFNTSCVLANPDTTTDAGFQRVEAVVAHEYFHNWSGNRVTCRDWFQLSLKEGFTVFRDSEFSADHGSETVKRVEDVQFLRTAQFAEDSGPMAHPVQPASFIEISNFYTLTIYEKGAEIVRMFKTLLGADLFRTATDLYFDRHDGQAVTIDEFVQAMADVSGRDFSQFMNWYRQAGTPKVTVDEHYDAAAQTYALTFSQSCPSTPEAASDEKKPFHIPVAMGLLGQAGTLKLEIEGETGDREVSDNTHRVLEFSEREQTFCFSNVPERPVPSLFRGFSAPVKIAFNYSYSDLLRLMTLDDDGFCRWNASQELGLAAIAELRDASAAEAVDMLLSGYRTLLEDDTLDPAMVALMFSPPAEAYLAEQQDPVNVDGNHHARQALMCHIAEHLEPQLLATYRRCVDQLQGLGRVVSPGAIGLRSLKNRALDYLMQLHQQQYLDLCVQQYRDGENMTDVFAALSSLVHCGAPMCAPHQQDALQSFYQRWQDEPLVVNQWFSVQAANPRPGTLNKVKQLLEHEAFDRKNPNKLRSVIGVFCSLNLVNFHQIDGAGYAFLAEQILLLDKQNPQVAARMLTPLTKWRRHDEQRQKLMKEQLQKIATAQLSKDVYEVVSRALRED